VVSGRRLPIHPSSFSLHPSYYDHVELWAGELQDWVPERIFDAHVHLGPPEVMGSISAQRRQLPLATFSSLTWEELQAWYGGLYRGKQVAGLVAFPFPLQEVDQAAANHYLIELMAREPRVRGFVLAHPTDVAVTRRAIDEAGRCGVRFSGVKPYYDLTGRSVFDCTMPDFIPRALLELMNAEGLVLMLHTSGKGMCEPANQDYLRGVVERFPRVPIILAHMGRYLVVDEFLEFCECGLLDSPMLYLEMSSATRPEVYRRALAQPGLERRLLFGSDLPFGLITGVEAWSERTGPIFVTRDRYPWSDPRLEQESPIAPDRLTYNSYHTIKALKDALAGMGLEPERQQSIKEAVFYGNAARLFGVFDAGTQLCSAGGAS